MEFALQDPWICPKLQLSLSARPKSGMGDDGQLTFNSSPPQVDFVNDSVSERVRLIFVREVQPGHAVLFEISF